MTPALQQFQNHMQTADAHAAKNDDRAASSFYMAAIKIAMQAGQLPPQLLAEARRAEQKVQEYSRKFETHIQSEVNAVGFDAASKEDVRFAQSMDILFGRKQIFQQAPRMFYYPEMPHIQFYGRDQFEWVSGLEAETALIQKEALAVFADNSAFKPYLTADESRPQNEHHEMLNNDDWGAFYLWQDGQEVTANTARCPATKAALAPLFESTISTIPNRSPNILFSLLRPGAKIPPHNGLINARLICHLPLIVPQGCGFRVGNERREWQEGEMFLFDDTIEHEAWNNSDKPRLILLFETWRPELSSKERQLISTMLAAVDKYNAPA